LNPEVAEAANIAIKAFIEEKSKRRRSYLAPNWQRMGFTSEQQAGQFLQIADLDTPVSERRMLIAANYHTKATTPTAQRVPPTQHDWETMFGSNNNKRNVTTFMVRATTITARLKAFTASTPPKKRFQIKCTEKLPHIKLPVGLQNECNLNVAVDSCAAMAMGYKQYHKAVADTFPHLIAEYIDFDEQGYQSFEIGGIGESDSIAITAAIIYITDFWHEGTRVKWMFALSDNCSANTLIGFPTIVDLKLEMSMHAGIINSTLLNQSFEMHMKEPARTAAPSSQMQDKSGALKQTLLAGMGLEGPFDPFETAAT
jgi:hypothetical protein